MSGREQKLNNSIFSLASAFLILAPAAQSYPEFQEFIEKNSGRSVNCAVCHTNGNGPVGKDAGQIGSLTEKDMAALNAARGAIEPEMLKQDSPILNRFGNSIIRTIGKRKFLECKQNPASLAEALGNKSDLDDDGIPDAQEYLEGTDSLNKFHGDPFKLFFVNLDRFKWHLIMAALACICLDWGFMHLIRGFALTSKARKMGLEDSQIPLDKH